MNYTIPAASENLNGSYKSLEQESSYYLFIMSRLMTNKKIKQKNNTVFASQWNSTFIILNGWLNYTLLLVLKKIYIYIW